MMRTGCPYVDGGCSKRRTTKVATVDKSKVSIIIPPNDYLMLPLETKQDDEELALIALLSLTQEDRDQDGCCDTDDNHEEEEDGDDDDDDDDDENDDHDESAILADLLQDVIFCCPQIFSKKAVIQELLRHGCDSIVMPILARQEIEWDRELVLHALTRCNCFYPRLPTELKQDHDIALAAIQRGTDPCEIPYHLLANKDFVVKALDADPGVFTECGDELGYDEDVLMKVICGADCNLFSQLDDILRFKFEVEPKEVLAPLARHVRNQLDAYESFQTFLKCMSAAASRGQGILPLQLLQCGDETGIAWKRQIAALLGAPFSRAEIANLAKVWVRVSSHCNCPSHNCSSKQVPWRCKNATRAVIVKY